MPDPTDPPPLAAADAYDVLPYPARAYPHTHPDHLATIATMFGLTPPPVATATVLEVGCAGGGNLIPMADALPQARFYGIDLSARQIESADRFARASGVSNLDLRPADLAAFASPDGDDGWLPPKIDYIIAHGIYSGATPATRDALLGLIGARLAPGGVAVVSYNTLPGWAIDHALRNVLTRHARRVSPTSPQGQARAARDLMDLMGSSQTFIDIIRSVRSLSDAALYHDYLCEYSEPVYYRDFAAAARGHGLACLTDADLPKALVQPLPPASKSVIGKFRAAGASLIDGEELNDLARVRSFRQTIICRDADAAAAAEPTHQASLERLKHLFVGSKASPAGDLSDNRSTYSIAFPFGVVSAQHALEPLDIAMFQALRDAWPTRVPFSQVVPAALQRLAAAGRPADPPDDGTAAIKLAIRIAASWWWAGLIELSTMPAPCAARPGQSPTVRRLARLQAELGDTVTTYRHENLTLNPSARELARLCDGTRDRPALLAAAEKLVTDRPRPAGPTFNLTDSARAYLAEGLDRDLLHFAKESLLQS